MKRNNLYKRNEFNNQIGGSNQSDTSNQVNNPNIVAAQALMSGKSVSQAAKEAGSAYVDNETEKAKQMVTDLKNKAENQALLAKQQASNALDNFNNPMNSAFNNVLDEISQANPAFQHKKFNQHLKVSTENMNRISENLKKIIENIKVISTRLGPVSEFPCEISKFITNKVCDLNSHFDKISTMVSPKLNDNLKKLNELSSQSLNDSLNLLSDVNKQNPIGQNLAKLTDSTSKLANIAKPNTGNNINNSIPLQNGGGDKLTKKKYNYNFIINPETGRKVNIKSKLGRKIVLNYISSSY